MTARFNQLFSWSHVATTRFGNALEQSNVTVAASDDVAIKAATRARSVERMAGILVKTTTREEFRGEEEERGDGRALFFGFKRPFARYISHLAQPQDLQLLPTAATLDIRKGDDAFPGELLSRARPDQRGKQANNVR